MSVYIPKMGTPKENEVIIIFPDNSAELFDRKDILLLGESKKFQTTLSVAPHGNLVDAEDVNNHILGWVDLRDCPIIIPADKEVTL